MNSYFYIDNVSFLKKMSTGNRGESPKAYPHKNISGIDHVQLAWIRSFLRIALSLAATYLVVVFSSCRLWTMPNGALFCGVLSLSRLVACLISKGWLVEPCDNATSRKYAAKEHAIWCDLIATKQQGCRFVVMSLATDKNDRNQLS